MTFRTPRRAPTSIGVGAVVALVSVVIFFVTNHANDQRETLLLQNDTSHAAALTSSALGNQVALLDALAATASTTDGSPPGFLTAARQLVHGPVSAALGKAYLAHFVIFASVGPSFQTGQGVPEEISLATHVAEASASPRPAVTVRGQGFLDLSAGAPMVPDGNIVLVELNLGTFIAANVTGPSFANLHIALYRSTHLTADNLLAFEGGGQPLLGQVASAPVRVANDDWTLVAKARSPLVGGFANSAPLIVLLLGLFLAVLSGLIVELSVRRRQATNSGLDQRTRSEPAVPGTRSDAENDIPHGPDSLWTGEQNSEAPVSPSPNQDATPGPSPSQREKRGSHNDKSGPHADWRPDPFGRSEARRFFLGAPTSVVRNGATEGYDPVAPLMEIPEHASTRPTAANPLHQQADHAVNDGTDRPPSIEGPLAHDSSEQIETPGLVFVDTPEILRTIATGVGRAVADEIEELRMIASEMSEYSTDHFTDNVRPEARPPIGKVESDSQDDGTIEGRRRESFKSVAIASGALGLASVLWRRRRKRRD
jgi:hypothetical protein